MIIRVKQIFNHNHHVHDSASAPVSENGMFYMYHIGVDIGVVEMLLNNPLQLHVLTVHSALVNV